MYCKYCGQQTDDDSRFCKKCGAELSSKETTINEPTIKKEVRTVNPTPYYGYADPVKNSNTNNIKIGIIVSIAIVLIIIFAYIGISNNPSGDTVTSDSRIATSSSTSSELDLAMLKNQTETSFISHIEELVPTITGKMKIDYGSYKFLYDEDIIVVGIDFTSKNAFNVDLKYSAKAIYDYFVSENKIALTLLAVDDVVYYEAESEITNSSKQSSDKPKNKASSQNQKQVNSTSSKSSSSKASSKSSSVMSQADKENLEFAIWCVNNYVPELTGKIIPTENVFEMQLSKIENSSNLMSICGFTCSTTDDKTVFGLTVSCEIDSNGSMVKLHNIYKIDENKNKTTLYDSSVSETAGQGIPQNAEDIKNENGILSYNYEEPLY